MKREIIIPASDSFEKELYPTNYEPRLPLAFLLDTSSSMIGMGISQLNQGLKAFEAFFIEDPVAEARLEIAIVTFASTVNLIREFGPIGNPFFPSLKAGGRTCMVEGIRSTIELIEARKNFYKHIGLQCHHPYIILITDGSPWPNKNTDIIAKDILHGVKKDSFYFQAFGAGKANMHILEKISHPTHPPKRINDYDFKDFFCWLIPSVSTQIRNPAKTLFLRSN